MGFKFISLPGRTILFYFFYFHTFKISQPILYHVRLSIIVTYKFTSLPNIEMLKNGPYPAFLKKRILGEKGHLPNVESGEVLVKVIGQDTQHITLAHLSEENNTPEVALETVKTILSKNKVNGVVVIPASQDEVGEVVQL